MEVVVGAVTQQLTAVRERRAELEKKLDEINRVRSELRELRGNERVLVSALAKLQGDRDLPRQRRRPADNEEAVRAWMRERNAPCTLTEIQRGVQLPLSSVRNAVHRMADVSRLHGRLWEIAR